MADDEPASTLIRRALDGDAAAARAFFEAEREAARRLLAAREGGDVSALVVEACARLEPLADELTRGAPAACARGCSWCCRGVKVEATVPEVLAIAEFLRKDRSEHERAELAREAAELAGATRELDAAARWARKTPCRFLDDASGACTVYAARPFVCRAHASFDAEACEQAASDPSAEALVPRHLVPAHVYGTAKSALAAACEEAGLDARNFELTNAFSIALNEPDAAARWFAGERVFDAAVIPSDERDRVRNLQALKKHGLLPPERLVASVRTRSEKNAAKRQRRAQRDKR